VNTLLPLRMSGILFIVMMGINALFAQNPPDSLVVDSLSKLVSRYRYDKPDSATYFALKGLQLAKKHHYTNGQALMLNQLGMIDDNVGKFDDSRKKYLQALSLYSQTQNFKGMATENIRLGVVEMRKGNYDKAIGYFLTALNLSNRSNNKGGQMEAYITLGEAYAGQKKFNEALKYYRVAEKLNNELPFSNLSLNLFNDIAIAYRETGRLEQAKPYLLKGIGLSNVKQYQGLNITLINTLASVYAKGGDINKSIELQKAALEKARKINNYIRQIQTLTGLASSYTKIYPKKALAYWNQALQLSQSKAAHKEQVEELQAIADLHKGLKDFKAAFEAKEQQYKIADEFFFKKMTKQIENLQSAYELNQSKIKVQQLQLANNKQLFERRAIMALLAGALIVLVIIAFYYYKTRKLNLLLHKSNTALQESNMVKDKLFSVLGHDLRSPFVSILNLIEIIDDEDMSPEQRKELLGQLDFTSRASLETLDSLLRWGQKQIKGIPLNQTKFNINTLINRTVTYMAGVAAYKDVYVANTVDEDITVSADADHVEFIIRNLLSNAIKYSSKGEAVIISSEYSAKLGYVIITVKDNGVGIVKDKLDAIFDITNESMRGTGNEKGTSLGLLLCREFIELNGGKIQVLSQPGEGSAFSISLITGA
jgi:signal transduction histidine kinase